MGWALGARIELNATPFEYDFYLAGLSSEDSEETVNAYWETTYDGNTFNTYKGLKDEVPTEN